ncbi:MAG TPA: DUF4349 domain-containing protein [Caldisericia bacterium]|nr:DUF4349 domain-containing protein [Caldisericia bacterium]HPF48826.1 DUF4349 domain-containing protein [Caldisericia bacterium]HPI84250.1 DUF4349 domain-containing protein [Caldisericia bacterium]HPQ93428.1 DUF4349 domain-containing protein [Caldisericia bacterium]HRV74886.1 DUF4349 domain-containing protein [Caldisericia bacterium]
MNKRGIVIAGVIVVLVAITLGLFAFGMGGYEDYSYDYDTGYIEEDEYATGSSPDYDGGYAGTVDDNSVVFNEQKVSSSYYKAEAPMMTNSAEFARDIEAPMGLGDIRTVNAATYIQMLKKDATISVKVENPYESYTKTQQQIEMLGGRQTHYNKSSSEDYIYITCTFNVPSSSFQKAVEMIEALDPEANTQSSEKNVTEEYIDMQSRLKAKRDLVEQLNKFYAKAKDVDDSINIYYQIQSVQEEIETIEGRMKYLEAVTSESTINVTFSQPDAKVVDNPTPSRFTRGMTRLWNDIQDGLVWLIGFILLLIPLSLVLGLLVWFGFIIYKKILDAKSGTISKTDV